MNLLYWSWMSPTNLKFHFNKSAEEWIWIKLIHSLCDRLLQHYFSPVNFISYFLYWWLFTLGKKIKNSEILLAFLLDSSLKFHFWWFSNFEIFEARLSWKKEKNKKSSRKPRNWWMKRGNDDSRIFIFGIVNSNWKKISKVLLINSQSIIFFAISRVLLVMKSL